MAERSTSGRRRSSNGKAVGIDEEGRLDEATLRRFVFQTFGRARRTQDSPVMPDVWLRYIRVAEGLGSRRIKPKDAAVDLLLAPWSGERPGEIAKRLRDRVAERDAQAKATTRGSRVKRARIALSDSRVVACADFELLVRDVVPLSGWWQRLLAKKDFEAAFDMMEETARKTKRPSGPDVELARLAALVGFVDSLIHADSQANIRELAALAHRLGPASLDMDVEQGEPRRDLTGREIELLIEMYRRARDLLRPVGPAPPADPKGIFLISLNRAAAQTLFELRVTTKADAAYRVFNIDATGIVFAVIDGGIDARHPAFLNRSDAAVKNGEGELTPQFCLEHSRLKETYDFTVLRDIVAYADAPRQAEGPNREHIRRLLKNKDHKEAFRYLAIRNSNARDLDWEIVRPLLRVPHKIAATEVAGEAGGEPQDDAEGYRPPGTDHGTHVAGILAADLPSDRDTGRELKGMCPQLSLYDLRVFDSNGRGDEFAILSAIEFVGWLNRDRANPVVHGVNLSLALAHDVDSFACGQTPICEACNHLVGAGTVVVTAAGNTGFEGGAGVEKQSLGSGYRTISITDPGNADNVITVGSTHRRDPHLYGVSYFSARGPTGDGRRKPDLLAPGEKITSTIRDGGSQRMDGTSMAAPHVAGAAALLMARYPELIGRPLRIKEILMRTATDLNREPSFQGAGLVDVLRALQSV